MTRKESEVQVLYGPLVRQSEVLWTLDLYSLPDKVVIQRSSVIL